MLRSLRPRLTYANVTATLALFIALGGSSYAALKIKRDSLGRRQIKESSLSAVPRAHNAARLGGLPAERFLVHCPQGTIPVSDVCVETQARPSAPYSSAVLECAATDNKSAPGRRLPTHDELMAALPYAQIQLASGGELTSDVYPSGSTPGLVDVLYITNEVGNVGITSDNDAGAKAYRCVADPLN
jgi:hypothetical protein